VKRIKARLTAEMKALRGHNAQVVLIRLNPIIRGWSAYYRHCVSSKVRAAPGILEAMKPGRMQAHGGTAEIPG